jgi:hypothetical protein
LGGQRSGGAEVAEPERLTKRAPTGSRLALIGSVEVSAQGRKGTALTRDTALVWAPQAFEVVNAPNVDKALGPFGR